MTREEAIKKLDSLKNLLPAAKDEIREIIKLVETPWVDVKEDLPCNHEKLINLINTRKTIYVLALVHGYIILSRMEKSEGKWHWTTDEPTYWMPIPKLPKK